MDVLLLQEDKTQYSTYFQIRTDVIVLENGVLVLAGNGIRY
jgi:hypothetical protein